MTRFNKHVNFKKLESTTLITTRLQLLVVLGVAASVQLLNFRLLILPILHNVGL